MADISKCTGKWCKSKETCYRYTAKASMVWQSYSDFWRDTDNNENKCSHYWYNGADINLLNKYKSELQQELNPKMDKTINQNKVDELRSLIKNITDELHK